jgi:GT2 family glycosyltransferase
MTQTRPIDFEVVVVSYHSKHQIEGLLAGLPAELPVAIVDNAKNSDQLREFAQARPGTRYVDSGGGAGYPRAANLGLSSSEYQYAIMLNPDARTSIDTLHAIIDDVRSDPTCASSSPLNVEPDGSPEFGVGGWEPSVPRAIVHALALHKVLPRAGLYARPRVGERIQLDWVTGSCMAVNIERFTELGRFDDRYYVYNEDMAYGYAARANGMYQKLRTDLTSTHAAGGSGAPSLEMLRLRGASMRRYLFHRRHRLPATVISGIIGVGYVVRTVVFRVLGRTARANEDFAYVKGIFTGKAWVAGQEVTDRD